MATSSSEPGKSSHVNENMLWRSLISEPHTGVSIVRRDGMVLYLNEQAANIFLADETDRADAVGQNLDALQPPEFVKERLDLIRRVIDENKPITFRAIWHGYQHLSWFYPVDDPTEVEPGTKQAQGKVLVVTRRVVGDADDATLADTGAERLDADVIDLGELDILSPRELVVIALLGRGLSLKETARMLHRSVRTIETQRDSIGQKLRLTGRGELIKLVQRVGLTIDDAQRTIV